MGQPVAGPRTHCLVSAVGTAGADLLSLPPLFAPTLPSSIPVNPPPSRATQSPAPRASAADRSGAPQPHLDEVGRQHQQAHHSHPGEADEDRHGLPHWDGGAGGETGGVKH
eukprot:184653-Chlamydomonas_euryale.AAC.3